MSSGERAREQQQDRCSRSTVAAAAAAAIAAKPSPGPSPLLSSRPLEDSHQAPRVLRVRRDARLQVPVKLSEPEPTQLPLRGGDAEDAPSSLVLHANKRAPPTEGESHMCARVRTSSASSGTVKNRVGTIASTAR